MRGLIPPRSGERTCALSRCSVSSPVLTAVPLNPYVPYSASFTTMDPLLVHAEIELIHGSIFHEPLPTDMDFVL